MQASGETPPAADVDADDMIARLVGSMDADEGKKGRRSRSEQRLVGQASRRRRRQFSGALTAVRFVPDPEAFFKGDDPYLSSRRCPQLKIVDLALTNQAASLDTMNTFSCDLEILALTKRPVAESSNCTPWFRGPGRDPRATTLR